MRIAVTGGGTGGHVYPALAVAAALQQPPLNLPPQNILYLGLKDGMEETLSAKAGFAFAPIRSAPVLGRSPLGVLQSGLRISSGTIKAMGALRRFDAHAVLATGGYVSVPVGVAAWLKRIPLLLYVPDLEPGLAVKLLAKFASKVAVTAPPATAALPQRKTVVTGYPVRSEFVALDKAAGRTRLNLASDLPVLLAWGGSQGAHTLNLALAEGAPQLLQRCQMVHICGNTDFPELEARRNDLPSDLQPRYRLYPYLFDEMPAAMIAADLAVSRSGASTLGELPLAELPAVLVPYPYAGGHQRRNAQYLADESAAVVLEEATMHELVPTVQALLQDPSRLAQMAQRAKALARPEAAKTIADLLVTLAAPSDAKATQHAGVD